MWSRAPSVVLITDPRFDRVRTVDVIRRAATALGPGRLLVQLRDKDREGDALRDLALDLRCVTRDAGALLAINGSASVARDAGADGVHLPSGDRAELASRIGAARKLLGDHAFVSTAAHDDDDVRCAIDGGATAVLVSPVFASPGKGPARGVGALASARALVRRSASGEARSLVIYALGGITAANAGACAAAGANGAAVIRELFDAPDVERAAKDLAAAFNGVS
jgi:thiamine-phosphate pyrophosphorylase